MNIIRRWHSSEQYFTHQTSGSTGTPKKIKISRSKIVSSAKATLSSIDPENQIKTSLLCISAAHIGGAMVVYRSLIFEHDLTIVAPSASPMDELGGEAFDLVSFVPMQFNKLSPTDLNCFRTVLIGGAPIEVRKVKTTAKIYSTFGMTETVSHIALRPIGEELFTTTGDTKVAIGDEGGLMINGSITDNKWLKTNDLVSIISNNSFKWIGRMDFVINSGGLKIHPEKVEQQLSDKVKGDIMISSLPDGQLGSKVILLSSGQEEAIDFGELEKYQAPKACYFNQQIFKTSSGKLDRLKTQEHFKNTL
ncbi:MAG: AMP-binding protein [Ekhidna sp.]